MADWKPEEFAVGDHVTDPSHVEWGVGTVTRAVKMGDMELSDGRVITYQRKALGQSLSIRFADGRTRTIITSSTPLKRAEPSS